MQTLSILIIGIALFYILLLLIFGKCRIVVGTISSITMKCKDELKGLGFQIIHADDFRNQGFDHKKSGIMALKKFFWKFLLFKKVALFTSNPRFLKLYFVNVLPLPLKIKSKRVTRTENLKWLKALTIDKVLIYLPTYFSKNVDKDELKQAVKRGIVFMEELENYPNDRFLPERKILDGNMGGMLIHN